MGLNRAGLPCAGVGVVIDGQQPAPAADAEFSDRLLAYVSRDQALHKKFMETTQLLRSPEWLASDEVASAVHTNWDELGKLVLQ